jgi:hypothetical protein
VSRVDAEADLTVRIHMLEPMRVVLGTDAAVNSHFCQRASHCRQMRRSLFHDAFGSTQDTPQEKNPAHRLVRNLLSVLEHTERLPVVMHERYACNLRL